MGIARKLLTSAGLNPLEQLESRQMLAGDLGVYDIACDAKFNWLVPGDKFNVVVDLVNDSFEEAAVGKVYVYIWGQDENGGGEPVFMGYKSVSFNLGPLTEDRNGNLIKKKTKVSVPVTLGLDFEAGDYSFYAELVPGMNDYGDLTYEDYNESNNQMSTRDSSRQQEYSWEFAYRVGTYDSGESFENDPRTSFRKNVKMSGSAYEELIDDNGDTVDMDGDDYPDYVYKKVSASLTGNGFAEGFFDESAPAIIFYGTDSTSAFSATVSGGKSGYSGFNQFDVDDATILVPGSLKSFKAVGFNFNACEFNLVEGDYGTTFLCNNFNGSSMNIGDAETDAVLGSFTAAGVYDSDITIHAPASSTAGMKMIVKNSVEDTEVFSTGRITSIAVGSWLGGQMAADTFGTIDSKGDLTASIFTTGVNRDIIDAHDEETPYTDSDVPDLSKIALAKLTVKGRAEGLWDFDGGVTAMSIGTVQTQEDGSGQLFITIAGRLGSFNATGNVCPAVDGDPDAAVFELYAFSMNSVTFNADVNDSVIKSGVAFPYAGIPWFPANGIVTGKDVREAGVINSFTVKGNISDTVVRAGFNPYEGDVDPSPFMKSEIKKIAIGGALAGSTEFLAAAMPATFKVKVAGVGTTALTVRRFTADPANPGSWIFPTDAADFEFNSEDMPWFRSSANVL